LNDYAFLDSVKLNDIRRINKVKISVKENGPLVASLLVESEAEGCNKLTREVRLLKGQDHVELVNVLDKKRAPVSSKPGNRTFAQKGGKESINFAFPFNVPGGAIQMDMPYATMRPEKDQIPGSCKNWLTASRWADVSNGETGITLVTLDAPLFEVGGITATMLGSQTNPEIWRKHIEPTQTLFSWVINNHWGTNYRAYQDGLITFRYALWPHKQYSPSENSRHAVGLSQPLLVKQASENQILKPAGIYPENSEVLITALKPCDDGKGRIMTLFNSSSSAIKTKLITKNSTLGNLWITDLGEGKKQKVSNNISFLPWETRMIRVE
jgi:alpha-mannosidase